MISLSLCPFDTEPLGITHYEVQQQRWPLGKFSIHAGSLLIFLLNFHRSYQSMALSLEQ